jgi:5-methylcytosine-specific restriction protein B
MDRQHLRDWLVRDVRPAGSSWPVLGVVPPDGALSNLAEEDQAHETLRLRLDAVGARLGQGVADLLLDLSQFYVREDKPAYWAIFDRLAQESEELLDDLECIQGLEAITAPEKVTAQSFERTYRFPPQDTKLRPNSRSQPCVKPAVMPETIDFRSIDHEAGTLVLRRSTKKGPLPDRLDLLPPNPIRKDVLKDSIAAVIDEVIAGAGRLRAVEDLLMRSTPRFVGSPRPDGVIPADGDLPGETSRAIAAMDDTVLAIQGPPGTGKTYVSALSIVDLVRTGRRVAVSSNRLLGWNAMTRDEYGAVVGLADDIRRVMADEWGWAPRDLWDVQGFVWAVNRADAPTDTETESTTAAERPKGYQMPTNLILYGPPGTGKTYTTAREAVRLCDGAAPGAEEDVRSRYAELSAEGRIRFVTFHQSYSYEDFVEGLRPTTGEAGQESSTGGFRLEPVPGVFREIASVAEQALRFGGSGAPFDMTGRRVFKMSLGRAGSEDHIFDAAVEGDYVVLGWGGEIDWTPFESYDAIHAKWNELHPETNGNDANIIQTARFRVDMREGDLIVVSYGNSRFRAIAEVVGPYEFNPVGERDYNHRRAVKWLFVPDEPLPITFYDKPFTMRSCYLLREDHLNRAALALLLPGAGVGQPSAPAQFVLICDEINRANISKVFGELITLIEPDKRIGGEYELRLTLPYSKHSFGVPSNLHIVGTMNTADRSIALLDTALRRRFTFREVMPEPRHLGAVDGLDLSTLLACLNDRIEYLFDREHQIGHAYLMRCSDREDPAADGEIGIRVACMTDMDVMPDNAPWIVGILKEGDEVPKRPPSKRQWRIKSDFPEGGLAQRRKDRTEKASGQKVQTFVADEWTLEFDLAYFGFINSVWRSAALALADDKIQAGKIKEEEVIAAGAEELTATLVLDTFFHAHHLNELKPWLLGARSGGFKDKKKGPPQLEGSRLLGRLKLHYVAMTRPSHLLCVAMRRDAFTNDELGVLKGRGWSVIDCCAAAQPVVAVG